VNKPMAQALVVLSGGQDSTTCLYWALAKWGQGQVEAVSFDYGQRHRLELECATTIARKAGVAHTLLPMDTLRALGGSSLVGSIGPLAGQDATNPHLPASFVPGRNLLFLTCAASLAYQRKIHHLVTGVAQTDYSGYPDCRKNTLDALEQALQLGMEWEFHLHTPLMYMSKGETVALAIQVGAMEALAYSHTCYEGVFPPCGKCASCLLRAKGFQEVGIVDPLITRFAQSKE